jgi:hypothetical protein
MEAYEELECSPRGITPSNNPFGGVDFKPTEFAPFLTFKLFGAAQQAKNAAFNCKACGTHHDPSTFYGNKDLYDKWVSKLANKFEEDLDTFKTEHSCMVLIFSLIDSLANDLLKACYSSMENPFKNITAMIATLIAIYYDDN